MAQCAKCGATGRDVVLQKVWVNDAEQWHCAHGCAEYAALWYHPSTARGQLHEAVAEQIYQAIRFANPEARRTAWDPYGAGPYQDEARRRALVALNGLFP